MSLLTSPLGLRRRTASTAAVDDFNAVAHATFDLSAEDFADMTSISALTDQTGNGHDAIQATTARQPLAQTASGLAVARFDGADDNLDTGIWSGIPQPITLIALAKLAAVPSANGYICESGVSGAQIVWGAHNGKWGIYPGSTWQDGNAADTLWHVFVSIFDGGTSRLYVDGEPTASGGSGTSSLQRIRIGSNYDGNFSHWDGDQNFLGAYTGDFEADDLRLLNRLGSDLADRAGISWTDIS